MGGNFMYKRLIVLISVFLNLLNLTYANRGNSLTYKSLEYAIMDENFDPDLFINDLNDYLKSYYSVKIDKGLSDKDVESVTEVINGGVNSLAERKNYTKWIKDIQMGSRSFFMIWIQTRHCSLSRFLQEDIGQGEHCCWILKEKYSC